ncbi:MAG TPA: FAD-dependent oxidoreductase [Microlunatus sp.]
MTHGASAPSSDDRSSRPVLLTVDDDPSVSRAVARDLRRRYGNDYRILRADSGPAALDAIREVVLRGEQVAVILADYRMPQMSGIDFLELAMDLVPYARRALLTAYADTDAAIAAINVVDVDHYLLKPWEPPEEKLYPVIDELLAAWQRDGHAIERKIKILGHPWSAPSYEVRDFLARNLVSYRWYNVADPDGQRLMAAAGATPDDIPVVITSDGDPLIRPALAELANAVGLSTAPTEEFYDLVIVGGGPAGLGAAVYGASEGLKTVIIERAAAGGQAGQSSRIENYLGFPDGVSGDQLTERARRQAIRLGAELITARTAVGLQVQGPARRLVFDDGSSVLTRAVLLATGVSYRELVADGLAELVGRGVYYGSASTQAAACAGDHVIIVGGANSAGQAAVFFARHSARVTLAVRGDSLERSMSSYLIEQIAAIDTIEVRTRTRVERCTGADHLECVTLVDLDDGSSQQVDAGHLFVFIGAAPLTGWLPAVLTTDDAGFVRTGPDLVVEGQRPVGWELDRDPYLLESSIPGVFVAGDVRSQSVKRVASAVGEGALAVTLVHRYLAE